MTPTPEFTVAGLDRERDVLALYRGGGEWFVYSWCADSTKEMIDTVCRDKDLTVCEKGRLLVRLLRGARL
jgi:hypothetical protein